MFFRVLAVWLGMQPYEDGDSCEFGRFVIHLELRQVDGFSIRACVTTCLVSFVIAATTTIISTRSCYSPYSMSGRQRGRCLVDAVVMIMSWERLCLCFALVLFLLLHSNQPHHCIFQMTSLDHPTEHFMYCVVSLNLYY